MYGLLGGIVGRQERPGLEAPMAVDGGAVRALGAGDRQGIGRARRRRLGDCVDVRLDIFGSHG